MNILSNQEFEKLVEKQSNRLRAMAKARTDSNPSGGVSVDDLNRIINVCASTGDKISVSFLKSLKAFAASGSLQKMKSNSDTWEKHAMEVAALKKTGKIEFGLFDHIMLKDSGKRGTVVDYLPDQKQYVIVLNPFQIQCVEKGELEKVACKVKKEVQSQKRYNYETVDMPDGRVFLFLDGEPVAIADPAKNNDVSQAYTEGNPTIFFAEKTPYSKTEINKFVSQYSRSGWSKMMMPQDWIKSQLPLDYEGNKTDGSAVR